MVKRRLRNFLFAWGVINWFLFFLHLFHIDLSWSFFLLIVKFPWRYILFLFQLLLVILIRLIILLIIKILMVAFPYNSHLTSFMFLYYPLAHPPLIHRRREFHLYWLPLLMMVIFFIFTFFLNLTRGLCFLQWFTLIPFWTHYSRSLFLLFRLHF